MKEKNYLTIYLLLTFGICWGILLIFFIFNEVLKALFGELTLANPLVMVALYAPTIAGMIIFFLQGKMRGIRGIVSKLIPRRQDLWWFPFLLMIALIFYASMHFGSKLFGFEVPKNNFTLLEMFKEAVINLFEETGLIGGAFGWVGFMLPYLQKKFNDNKIPALLTGLAFGLLVLPGYVVSSFETATLYPFYVAQLMVFMLFFSYIFNATNGSILMFIYSFWLIASGSRLQLYYFNPQVQILQLVFFGLLSLLMFVLVKQGIIKQKLQTFPDYIYEQQLKDKIDNDVTIVKEEVV